MNPLLTELLKYWPEVAGAAAMLSYAGSAAISTSPQKRPRTKDDYYTWFREWGLCMINHRSGAADRPTSPAPTPGQPQP